MNIIEKIDKYLNESGSSQYTDIGNGWYIVEIKGLAGGPDWKLIPKGANKYRGEVHVEGAQDARKKTITVRAIGVYNAFSKKEKKEIKPGLEKWAKKLEKTWTKPVKVQIPTE